MPKSANKSRSEVALPEPFGKGVFIRFTIDVLERLESEFGDDYVEAIIDGTGKARASVFKKVLQNAVVGDAEVDYEALQSCMEETRGCIMDALFLTIHGRTVEEQLVKEEEDRIAGIQKNLERMNEDPRMAEAIAFLQRFGAPGTEPVSAPTNSGT